MEIKQMARLRHRHQRQLLDTRINHARVRQDVLRAGAAVPVAERHVLRPDHEREGAGVRGVGLRRETAGQEGADGGELACGLGVFVRELEGREGRIEGARAAEPVRAHGLEVRLGGVAWVEVGEAVWKDLPRGCDMLLRGGGGGGAEVVRVAG